VSNGVIAFLSTRDGAFGGEGQTIYSVQPDGSALTEIVAQPMYSTGLTWSPDGTQLAFARGAGEGAGEVDVVGAGGTGLATLTTAGDPPVAPAWSPDGLQVAFFTGDGHIEVVPATGGDPVVVAGRPADCQDEYPAWSPDGSRIVFDRLCGDGPSSLYVVPADGTGEASPLGDPAIAGDQPSWSPDGSKIAFDHEGTIDVVGADGSGAVTLAGDGSYEPAWSPDGSKIAFQSKRDGSMNVYVMNADGSGVTKLTDELNPRSDFSPAWQPVRGDSGQPSPAPTPLPTIAPSPAPLASPSPTTYPSSCQSSVRIADFDGDGVPDVATVVRTECAPAPGAAGLPWELQVSYSGGSPMQVAGIKFCQDVCQAFTSPDIDGDGTAELGIVVTEGASTEFLQFYSLRPTDPGLGPLSVAPPGAPGFDSNLVANFGLGGTVQHMDTLQCRDTSDGTRQLVASHADNAGPPSFDTWNVHETVLTLQDRSFVVVSTRDYTEPATSSTPSFQSAEDLCGSNLGGDNPSG
jgi:TolB protein